MPKYPKRQNKSNPKAHPYESNSPSQSPDSSSKIFNGGVAESVKRSKKNSEPKFIVETIRSHTPKTASRTAAETYTVKWKGYPESENTEEDSGQIEIEVPECVNEYWPWVGLS